MSTSFYFKFGLLISFLLFISIYADSYQENNNNDDDDDVLSMIYPKYASVHRIDRSSLFYPRANRNSWFRVSTYQHMKPSNSPEEKNGGDNLMRWG
jgi:hypothetical protein